MSAGSRCSTNFDRGDVDAMKISIACDHGAFDLKERLKAHLIEQGHQVADCGTHSTDSCD